MPDTPASPPPSAPTPSHRRRPRLRRPLPVLVASGALVVGLAACSSSHSPAATPVPSTPSGTPPTTTALAPSASSGPSTSSAPLSPHAVAPPATPATTTSATLAECPTGQLSASLDLGARDVGAGQLSVPLVFTNTGSTPCRVQGYPGVSLLDGHGAQLGAPAVETPNWPTTRIVLAPGQQASTTLHTVNGAGFGAPCEAPSASVRIYPPGMTTTLVIPSGGFTVCANTFTVTPLVPGASGVPAS